MWGGFLKVLCIDYMCNKSSCVLWSIFPAVFRSVKGQRSLFESEMSLKGQTAATQTEPDCKQLMPRHSSPSVSEEFKKLCFKHSRWKRSHRVFQRHKQKSVSCHRVMETGVSLCSDDLSHTYWLTSIHSCLFCPFTKPRTSLRDTFWLHVAFLHHDFSFYFTWTFLSFHFCV